MAMRAGARQSSARIVRDPRILEGEPVVMGTRVPVRAIVLTHRFEPNIAALTEAYPMLDAAGVQAALVYYDTHREEIDRYIAENAFEGEA